MDDVRRRAVPPDDGPARGPETGGGEPPPPPPRGPPRRRRRRARGSRVQGPPHGPERSASRGASCVPLQDHTDVVQDDLLPAEAREVVRPLARGRRDGREAVLEEGDLEARVREDPPAGPLDRRAPVGVRFPDRAAPGDPPRGEGGGGGGGGRAG